MDTEKAIPVGFPYSVGMISSIALAVPVAVWVRVRVVLQLLYHSLICDGMDCGLSVSTMLKLSQMTLARCAKQLVQNSLLLILGNL